MMDITEDGSPPPSGIGALTMVVAPASDHIGGLDLQSLMDYVSREIGMPINLVRCENYGEAIAALASGAAALGWLGPQAYVEAAREGRVEPFAVGVPLGGGSPNYQSLFVVRDDSAITTLAEVRGRRIAVGDPHSTSGYNVPRRELADIGIRIDSGSDFIKIVQASNHDEALRMVIDGVVDVAPVSSVNYYENVRTGAIQRGQLRIIHKSPDIPGAPLVYAASLAPALKRRIKDIVLGAHEHMEIGGYGGALERYVDPAEARLKLLEAYIRPQWTWKTYLSIFSLLGVIWLVSFDLEVDPLALMTSAGNYFADVIGRMMPPDFTDLPNLLLAMLETVEIALLGTVLAISISIPVALSAARNTAPNYAIYLVARLVTVFFRAIPEFILAMILVIAIGFGAMPGVLALGFHTMGFLAKFYADAAEDVDSGPVDALNSMGAPRMQVVAFAIVPQIIAPFIGYNLYILDRNIRMATMLGIVGAGGIGYELQAAFRMFEYQRVSAIIILIFVTIFAIDMISSRIRAKFH
ncbi:MAG: phosphonate ABC transporter, permease protein PhnE [Proteobacteria bacterium]|nr:phosphonate ABC transporter, permease protein PhnE [Pseudomonadota bacterium]